MGNDMSDAYAEIRRLGGGQSQNPDTVMASFDRRLSALFDRVCKLEDGRDGLGTPEPLPAPSLTEDAIVAALKADPGMAGRVMAHVAYVLAHDFRSEIGAGAKAFVGEGQPWALRAASLQSLAVALAAASYRG